MSTQSEILELYKERPEIIESSIIMDNVNSSITIFEGHYTLKNDDQEMQIEGSVTFKWLPNNGVIFSGKPSLSDRELVMEISQDKMYDIICEGFSIGEGFINNSVIGNSEEGNYVSGVLKNQAVTGDKSVPVSKVRFTIPNLRDFHGSPVKKISGENIKSIRGRIELEDDNYHITIDKCLNYTDRKKLLESNGGYIIQYNGELISKKGVINFNNLDDILHCLNTFLTFLNGSRTSAFFIQGIHDEEVIWCDYSNYYVDTYKSVQTWPQRLSVDGLNELWKAFRKIWKEDKRFLTSSIHWYIEANKQSGFSEGSIIMAQTALELLYNWWIIERKKLILGKDSENIVAANKIRLLISQLGINTLIPKALVDLQDFKDTNKDTIADAVDTIVQIRNAIVHSQEEKRKKLDSIPHMAICQALQLSIWYIELSLLCILDFNGKYFNRCSSGKFKSESEDLVPWSKK